MLGKQYGFWNSIHSINYKLLPNFRYYYKGNHKSVNCNSRWIITMIEITIELSNLHLKLCFKCHVDACDIEFAIDAIYLVMHLICWHHLALCEKFTSVLNIKLQTFIHTNTSLYICWVWFSAEQVWCLWN